MTEPSLALQTAIRSRLIETPTVTALVVSDHIIDGPARPETLPTIIIGSGQTILAGHAYSLRSTWVYLELHIWAVGGDTAAVKQIAGAVWNALEAPITVPEFMLTNGLEVERTTYMRDPTGLGHAVVSIKALMGEFIDA